jgi:predicted dehydrogenase
MFRCGSRTTARLPRFLKVPELVQDGAIGDVRMVITRHFQRIPTPEEMRGPVLGLARSIPARSGGGIFFEAVGHTLDILDFIRGPIASVRAFADNRAGAYPPEDIRGGGLQVRIPVPTAAGAWCFAADCDDEYNEIVGATGRHSFLSRTLSAARRRGADRPPVLRSGSCAAMRSRKSRLPTRRPCTSR